MASNKHQIQPATGLARLVNLGLYGLSHLLPEGWRINRGWLTWENILDDSTCYGVILSGSEKAAPAARLMRLGINPPISDLIWPRAFNDFHKSWHWDCWWECVSPIEMAAWATIWKTQSGPVGGQYCLDRALVGCAQAGLADHVALLLEHGASAHQPVVNEGEPRLLRQVLGATICIEDMIAVLQQVQPIPGHAWQEWLSNKPVPRMRAVEDLEKWRQSGAPIPQGEAALFHALAWVDDPTLDPDHVDRPLQALAWWFEHGNLPANARTHLLQDFIANARANSQEHQQSMRRWTQFLLREGLPPRPEDGPGSPVLRGLPWSHHAAYAPFPESLPIELMEALHAEPDSWTARNNTDETVGDIYKEVLRECGEIPDREHQGERLRSWISQHRMSAVVAQVEPKVAVAPAPARRF